MQKLKGTIIALVAMFGLVALPLVPVAVHASAVSEIKAGTEKVNDGNSTDLTAQIKTVVNLILFILGIIAVIMIIIGGLRYTTSNGDAGGIKTAKDTILYAVIGLIVAILAFAIVNFVVDSFTSTSK